MSEQQNLETATTAEPAAVPLINEIALHAPEQQYRAGAYSLLAALLRDVPTAEVLKQAAGMSELAQDKDDLGLAMSMLGLAAQHSDPASVDDEYHDLFIGLAWRSRSLWLLVLNRVSDGKALRATPRRFSTIGLST